MRHVPVRVVLNTTGLKRECSAARIKTVSAARLESRGGCFGGRKRPWIVDMCARVASLVWIECTRFPVLSRAHICGCNRTNCVPHSGPGVWGSRVAVGLWVILCVLCGTCCGVEALSLSVYRGDALGSCVGSLVYGFYSRVTSTPPVNIAGAVPVGFYRCMPNRFPKVVVNGSHAEVVNLSACGIS